MPSPEYLTTAETAELLRRPVQTLYQWRRRGYGPTGVRVGREVLYRADDVARFLDDLRAQAEADAAIKAEAEAARRAARVAS